MSLLSGELGRGPRSHNAQTSEQSAECLYPVSRCLMYVIKKTCGGQYARRHKAGMINWRTVCKTMISGIVTLFNIERWTKDAVDKIRRRKLTNCSRDDRDAWRGKEAWAWSIGVRSLQEPSHTHAATLRSGMITR